MTEANLILLNIFLLWILVCISLYFHTKSFELHRQSYKFHKQSADYIAMIMKILGKLIK